MKQIKFPVIIEWKKLPKIIKTPRKDRWRSKYPFSKLKVGQSFAIKCTTGNHLKHILMLVNNARNKARKNPANKNKIFTVRNLQTEVRAFRIK